MFSKIHNISWLHNANFQSKKYIYTYFNPMLHNKNWPKLFRCIMLFAFFWNINSTFLDKIFTYFGTFKLRYIFYKPSKAIFRRLSGEILFQMFVLENIKGRMSIKDEYITKISALNTNKYFKY